jgi:hypothetical protein
MWALLVITIIAEGAIPSQFKTVKYPTYQACIRAQAQAEQKPATFGYCNYERVKTK